MMRYIKNIKMSRQDIPNILTYGRIAIIPMIAICLFLKNEIFLWIALIVFIIAAISDFLDGYLARKWLSQSKLGKMLDPIADKLLVSVCLMMLVYNHTISGIHLWAAIVILFREVLVSGLREYLGELYVKDMVKILTKVKTLIQMIAIALLIAGNAGEKIFLWTYETAFLGLWIAALLTLYTGYEYLKIALISAQEEKNKP